VSWSGLRGAVPIVLALIPLTDGVPGSQELVAAVFVLVVVLTLVQGGTLPMLAKLLGLAGSVRQQELEIDAAPLDDVSGVLIQVRIQEGSKLHGVYLYELRLPTGSTMSLVVRDGTPFTPDRHTRLAEGDELLLVTTEAARSATERRVRAVDRAGKFARWRGETGD
jgi:cell volume regulation protein A